jgi:hypothetical protein
MPEQAAITSGSHPAPHRRRISLWALSIGLVLAPALWAFELTSKYAVTSVACYGSDVAQAHPVPAFGWVWPYLVAIDVVTLAVAAIGGWLSYQAWIEVRHEVEGHAEHLAEVGEGRTRFLAFWGMLVSMLVGAAVIFSFIADVGLPPCS